MRLFLSLVLLLTTCSAASGTQQYEELSDIMRASIQGALNDNTPPHLFYDGELWLKEMSERLQKIVPRRSKLQDTDKRLDFLQILRDEAHRVQLDPQLILAIVHVESAFRQKAVSAVGARGYMQVMPFWVKLIGDHDDNKDLFDTRTNLRFGTVILQHYLDLEKDNLFRALGRYNGSLGRSRYPNAVTATQKKYWTWP